MASRRFNDDDEILVVGDDSDFKGHWGRVIKYEPLFERYFVVLPDVSPTGHFAFTEDQLTPLPEEEDAGKYHEDQPDEDSEEEVHDEVQVPAFGMSEDDFVKHLEWMIERSLTKVATVGPRDAFFGFQDFEGSTPQEILFSLLNKLEEGIALFAQAHILVARIGVAMSCVHPEVQNDQE